MLKQMRLQVSGSIVRCFATADSRTTLSVFAENREPMFMGE